MKRVYIAGAYSSDNVLGVLDNIRKGMRAGLDVLLLGYAPFVPWFDHQFQFMLQDGESLNVETYKQYSMAWLEASQAVYVIPGYEKSMGTMAEITRAHELNIPVYYDLLKLRLEV
jgi:hypothetical protein